MRKQFNQKRVEKTVDIFDLSIFGSSKEELLTILAGQLIQPFSPEAYPWLVMTPNPEQVVLTRKDAQFLADLQDAHLLLPDGVGLIWASRWQQRRTGQLAIKERIPGREVVAELLARAARDKLTVLVIGGRDLGMGTTTEQPSQLRPIQLPGESKPMERTNWWWSEGYRDVSQPTEEEEQRLSAAVAKLRPALVFVAFGAPHQERWLVSHRRALAAAGVRLAMAVGGSFDILTGKLRPAPRLMQQLHLEWLYRLFQEPWRWRRQLRLLEFIWLTIRDS